MGHVEEKNPIAAYTIDDLSDVTATTPIAGDSLVFEDGEWVSKNVTNILGAGVGMPLYLDDTVVVDNYGSLLKIPDTVTAEQTASVAVTAETGFIQGFFYNAELLRAAWNAGEWIFNIWGKVSSTAGVSTVIATMYKVPAEDGTVTTTGTGTSRTATISGSSGTPFVSGDANADQTLAGYLQTAGGTFQITGYTSATVVAIATATEYTNETAVACTVHKYLFQAETGEINNTTATTTLHNVSIIQATVDLNLTDKAALRIYGKTTAGGSITISITYNGTDHYTNFRAPIYPKHNDLDGLDLGDYQHATAAEQAAWDAKQAALTAPIDDKASPGEIGGTTPAKITGETIVNKGPAAVAGDGNLSTSGSSTTVTLPAADYAIILEGATVVANSLTRHVLSKDGSNQVTINTATDWSTGYTFTRQNPITQFITSADAIAGWLRADGEFYLVDSVRLDGIAYLKDNIGIGTVSFGTNLAKGLAMSLGTAPSNSPADTCQLYAADIAADNTAFHFVTENGSVVKIYRQNLISNPTGGTTTDAEARTAITSILTLLKNNGLMASS